MRKAPGVWSVARGAKRWRRSGGEMVGIVVQYGMESRHSDWRKARIIPIYKKVAG